MSNKRKKLLQLYISQNKKCFYCNCDTVLPKLRSNDTTSKTATIEHLYSKLDIRRFLLRDFDAVVLACKSCNNGRAYREYDLVFNNGTYLDKDYSPMNGKYKNIVTETFKNE